MRVRTPVFVLLAAVAALGVVWLVAPRSAAVADLPREKVFRRLTERAASLDPIKAASTSESRAIALVYEPLLEVDYRARPYRLKPCLCELPEISSNRLEYTFRIREGARFRADPCFPNGASRPVVADDIVYSLQRLMNPPKPSSGTSMMSAIDTNRLVAVDARTVRIGLKHEQYFFPWLMSMAYAAVIPHEAVEKYGAAFGSMSVGSGPYYLEEWWREHRMRFRRDPDWHGWKEIETTPYEEIEYLVVGDTSTQWLMFLSGELDFLGDVNRDNWDAVIGADGRLLPELASRGVQLHRSTAMAVYYVGMNMKDPLLGSNRKLRQALNCAFDARTWNRFFNDRHQPSDGPVPPGVEGRLETPFPYAYDVAKAKRLLVEAGYPDGIDPRTGKRLVISIALGRADQGVREEVELLQSFFDAIGIRLEPNFMTWTAYLKTVSEGNVSLFMMGWVLDYPDPENFLQLFLSRNASPGANHCNYANPAFDRLYDQAMTEPDPEKRNAIWRAAQEIVREDCPWIFLYFARSNALSWGHVGNYIPSDFPYGTEKYLYRK